MPIDELFKLDDLSLEELEAQRIKLLTDRLEMQNVLASWYGPGFYGLPTASGELFTYSYTVAHNTLPFGTEVIVSYQGNSIQATVTDRGPYVGNRELDLSEGAAQALGFTQVGVDYVDVEYVDGGYASSGNYGVAVVGYPNYLGSSESYITAQEQINSGVYIVQWGDTLSDIAAQLGTSTEYLATYNGIYDPDIIYSGQALYY